MYPKDFIENTGCPKTHSCTYSLSKIIIYYVKFHYGIWGHLKRWCILFELGVKNLNLSVQVSCFDFITTF